MTAAAIATPAPRPDGARILKGAGLAFGLFSQALITGAPMGLPG